MSSQRTLARPYANACFELALAHQTIGAWSEVLTVLGMSVSTAELRLMLDQPEQDFSAPIALLKEVLAASCAESVTALGDKLDNFLALLVESKRFNVLPEMAEVFAVLLAKHESTVNVEAVSAEKITDQQQQALKAKLEKRFNTNVHLDVTEDASLIGGMVLKSGNWVMDGSIKGKIERLNEDLLQ